LAATSVQLGRKKFRDRGSDIVLRTFAGQEDGYLRGRSRLHCEARIFCGWSADSLSIEPKDKYHPYRGNDPRQRIELSRDQFDHLLWKLNSIKTLGNLEKEPSAYFSTGGIQKPHRC
jgi:hypothetical protein